MNKKYTFIIFFSLLFGTAHTTDVTIFIHGTLFSGLAFLKPFKLWHDTLENDATFKRAHQLVRSSACTTEQQFLLKEGLKEITVDDIHYFNNGLFGGENARCAAYSLTPAYAAINSLYNPHQNHAYYTFGWSGILSHSSRQFAAEKLYEALTFLKKKYNSEVNFHIVAHSHGGNVALQLPYYEEKHKQNLSIETLSLYGTPIQKKTVHYALLPFFKKIVNFYSRGDITQQLDFFSAKGWSFQTFSESLPEIKSSLLSRYDIELRHNTKHTPFDHLHLFLLGCSKKIISTLGPLPLVTLNGAFIGEVEKLNHGGYKAYRLSLNETNNEPFHFKLYNRNGTELYASSSPELHDTCKSFSALATKQWKPLTTGTINTSKQTMSLFQKSLAEIYPIFRIFSK